MDYTYVNGVTSDEEEEVPAVAAAAAVQSGAITRLTTDPFLNTSCCSSVYNCTSCGHQRSYAKQVERTRGKWVTQHWCQVVLGCLNSLRSLQGTVCIFAGLPLYPRVCSRFTTGIEECGGRLNVQAKGSIEIFCEFGPCCACVEALNGGVWE